MLPVPHPIVLPVVFVQIGIAALLTWLIQPADPLGAFLGLMVILGLPATVAAVWLINRMEG